MNTRSVSRISVLFALLFLIGIQSLFAECQYKQIIKGEELSVGIMLTWSTSLEKENAMFIIERSEDGIQFMNIGAVKGAGFSTKHKEYSFLDNTAPSEQRYYRLRQIDFNGIFSTSPIFVFNKYTPDLFSISNIHTSVAPNQLEIQFDAFEGGLFEFELMDWQGKSLLISNTETKKGFNTLKVNLDDHNDLIFQLTLRSLEQEQTISFRKKQVVQ